MTISDASASLELRGTRRRNSAVFPVMAVGAGLAISVAWLGPASMAAAAALYAVVAAVVVARIRDFHPFNPFGAANLVTLVRAGMVALLTALILEPLADASGALSVVALAVAILVLDGLDGWLARRAGTVSSFGARFDMEVDALLIMVLAVSALLEGKAGWWVLLLGLMRYAFVVAGLAFPALAGELPPSTRRKLVCVVQIVILAVLALPAVQSPWSDLLALVALILLSWSFLVDTFWLARAKAGA